MTMKTMRSIVGCIFLAALCFRCTDSLRVCYPVVGCFYNDPPYNNVIDLPEDPAKTRTDIWLFTRENEMNADFLDYKQAASINASHFDAGRPTKVIVPGFGNSYSVSEYISIMKDELLKKDDFNVIVIDYYAWAHMPNYTQAVANIRLVATQLKLVLSYMQRDHNLDLGDVHLIGHSIGAHLSGYVGELFKGEDRKPVIGRISATDAAQPNFDTANLIVRLDPYDALFVDVIHTNGHAMDLSGGFGTAMQLGHTDFYLNGGAQQPGCVDGIVGAVSSVVSGIFTPSQRSIGEQASRAGSCSHGRSHDIYIESIKDESAFTAYRCSNYNTFLTGVCLYMQGNQYYARAGYNANKYPPQGLTYLLTSSQSPFSGSHYNIVLRAAGNNLATRGNLHISLGNLNGAQSWVSLLPSEQDLGSYTSVSKVVLFRYLMNPLQGIYLQFIKSQPSMTGLSDDYENDVDEQYYHYANSFGISSLEVFVAATQERYCITQGVSLRDGQSQWQQVRKQTGACPSYTVRRSVFDTLGSLTGLGSGLGSGLSSGLGNLLGRVVG